MPTDTNHAPTLESEAAVTSILAQLVRERQEREQRARPAREQSVIDRARAAVIAHRASMR